MLIHHVLTVLDTEPLTSSPGRSQSGNRYGEIVAEMNEMNEMNEMR